MLLLSADGHVLQRMDLAPLRMRLPRPEVGAVCGRSHTHCTLKLTGQPYIGAHIHSSLCCHTCRMQ